VVEGLFLNPKGTGLKRNQAQPGKAFKLLLIGIGLGRNFGGPLKLDFIREGRIF